MKPYIVFWFGRVFGTYDTKPKARQAVDDKIKEDPKLTLADFILQGPKSEKELNNGR